jgi:GBP family porin
LLTPSVDFTGAYTYTEGTLSTASGEHHPKWQDLSVQTDYILSKRTDVYLQASYQHIASDGSGLTADISGELPSSRNEQVVIAAGLRHRF